VLFCQETVDLLVSLDIDIVSVRNTLQMSNTRLKHCGDRTNTR